MKITVVDSKDVIRLCTVSESPRLFASSSSEYPIAADQKAVRDGNMLIANTERDLALEISDNASIKFDEDCVIALTGADFGVSSGGRTIPRLKAYMLDAGDTLEIEREGNGKYLYVCINGSFAEDSPAFLSGGDSAEIVDAMENVDDPEIRVLSDDPPQKEVTLRLIPGPFADEYDMRDLDLLYTIRFTVMSADRKGITLTAHELTASPCSDYPVLSPEGTVTVDENGHPYISLADSPETSRKKGAAVVISADMPKLSQLSEGCFVSFEPCTINAAQKLALKKRKEYIHRYLAMNDI